jgi:curved DNA binding protein
MEEDIQSTTRTLGVHPDVPGKYNDASVIGNKVMLELLNNLKPGVTVQELCELGDKLIVENCLPIRKKKLKENEKGIAFPTCISVNNCVGNFSPLSDDPLVKLKGGDVVKIDLGVHIHGFICSHAHTYIVPDEVSCPPPYTGKKADVICAAYYAAECALHLLRPGHTNNEVTQIIKKCAESFKVNPVEAVLSHELKQYVIDANNVILNREEHDQKVAQITFEENQAYCVDVVMSTGTGKKMKEGTDTRTTVFKRALDRNYQLKSQASRDLFREINTKFPSLVFSLRGCDPKKRRIGIKEIVSHDLVDAYPVLYEREGEFVAQFKFTALILPKHTIKLTASFPLPHVTSTFDVSGVPEIQNTLALPLTAEIPQEQEGAQMEVV